MTDPARLARGRRRKAANRRLLLTAVVFAVLLWTALIALPGLAPEWVQLLSFFAFGHFTGVCAIAVLAPLTWLAVIVSSLRERWRETIAFTCLVMGTSAWCLLLLAMGTARRM